MVGNLLVGDIARDRFVQATVTEPVSPEQKCEQYTVLAQHAANGEPAGSSAGGEQPKFTAYATTSNGARHVIVKFSEIESGPVTERWRDLLLAEHLALLTLREGGLSAAHSEVIDSSTQRFLEIERFDRVGEAGRRGMHSLAALDAAFIGSGNGSWPVVTRALANDGRIDVQAAAGAELLWAFGTLIGNTDMHFGNLSFIDEQGPPYSLAPAYDMTPMGFRPRSSGGLSNSLPSLKLSDEVSLDTWQQAIALAETYLERILKHHQFSARFAPCTAALRAHLDSAQRMMRRLA
jgi:serine/threonine protein kinase HipA of HipAB toxin-antitoxin module